MATVTMYEQDVLRVCSFNNLCWDGSSGRVLIVIDGTDQDAQAASTSLAECRHDLQFYWCRCIMGGTAFEAATYVARRTPRSLGASSSMVPAHGLVG